MARTVEQVVKNQLGNLMTEVAVLTAENEQLREQVAQLQAQLPKDKDEDEKEGPNGPR